MPIPRVPSADPDPLLIQALQALAARHGLVLVWDDRLGRAFQLVAKAPPPHLPLGEYLEAVERRHILEALRLTGWNKSESARRLGMRRTTLLHRLRALGIPARPSPTCEAVP